MLVVALQGWTVPWLRLLYRLISVRTYAAFALQPSSAVGCWGWSLGVEACCLMGLAQPLQGQLLAPSLDDNVGIGFPVGC